MSMIKKSKRVVRVAHTRAAVLLVLLLTSVEQCRRYARKARSTVWQWKLACPPRGLLVSIIQTVQQQVFVTTNSEDIVQRDRGACSTVGPQIGP